ncbi:MAG: LemA family protein, partial [Lachnospiraceae bacterium]|nr:LemA family protein [Lachnospiraceae bacterium]
VELRSGMSIKEKSAANQSMDELHREINVIAEQYPELRSSNTFVELERAIVDVEEHLQAARRLYNANVTAYNAKLITFPNSIVAGAMGATEKELFEAEESKRSDVKMEF